MGNKRDIKERENISLVKRYRVSGDEKLFIQLYNDNLPLAHELSKQWRAVKSVNGLVESCYADALKETVDKFRDDGGRFASILIRRIKNHFLKQHAFLRYKTINDYNNRSRKPKSFIAIDKIEEQDRIEYLTKNKDEGIYHPEDIMRKMELIMSNVTKKERVYLELRFWYGYRYREIGRVFGVTASSVHAKIAGLMKRLKKVLQQDK